MGSWNSYSSIFNLGHKAVQDLLSVPVIVEEKVDGSQFSFGLSEEDGGILVRSKGAVMFWEAPEKMFSKAVDKVVELKYKLIPGWTYRAEYLAKPRHNVLAYDRVPLLTKFVGQTETILSREDGYLILFDIAIGENEYLPYDQKKAEADRLGLECVPKLFEGTPTLETIRQLLDTESVLGGQKIEGVVIKPREYNLFGVDKKVLMGKFVSEAFKEVHSASWKEANPSRSDVIEMIAAEFRTPARWAKAAMHLAEQGKLTDSPKDIGNLMAETIIDVEKECLDEIKERMFKYAWPHIRRKLTYGLPEWWKDCLLKKQFEEPVAA